MKLSILGLVMVISGALGVSVEEYMKLRSQTLETELNMMLGGSLTFSNSKEILVNDILMEFKSREYAEGLDSNGEFFAGAKHFFHAKESIDGSNVFKIIRLLPKGAALHTHDVTVGDVDFVVRNLTTLPNLYYCLGDEQHLLFHFYPSQPSSECIEGSGWKPVAKLRAEASSPQWVDHWFSKSMSMYTPTPEIDYPDTNAAWKEFEKKITTISGVANYEPALKAYMYNVLKDHYEDNVMYLELRGLLQSVYHLNQTELTNHETLRAYKEATDEFLRDYPTYWGAKFIYAPHRFNEPSVIGSKIDDAAIMKQNYPSFFAGFDLVGQEDVGAPLLYYLPQLLNAADKGIQFFFHAGETDWHGTKVDENIVDATLLNSTRFGHGYALYSHPLLYEITKERGIGVEVCPISNQVLRLVEDFRNHPGSNYMRNNFPLVIAADGPGMWGATPLSHDWYIAFMTMGGERADLRFLKQLAVNSITYSAMSVGEKTLALSRWEIQWSQFLDRVIAQYPSSKDAQEDNVIV